MRGELEAMIDRRLAASIALRMRRNWPLLKLVPAPLIVPIVMPGARRLRRALARGAIIAVAGVIAGVVLIALAA